VKIEKKESRLGKMLDVIHSLVGLAKVNHYMFGEFARPTKE
jgi:hypothetical protein